ncbi:AI-2E family transporter [Emticicia sp. CRIBPO]|uniref:AI-2E family transporter n=1 Tax=Emticicia sp. CRIBPO TaxID=2683258 RepID=UPI00141288A8|nr:AI-2E family transporter [Emticicia sp. CRIBPO]NBA86910.1 AI-2E family transporter [Emticicia sp. CRIBPO]
MRSHTPPFSIKFAASLIVLVVLVFVLFLLKDVLVPLCFSGLLAFILLPICVFFENRKVPRALAIVFALIIALSCIFFVFYLAYIQIADLNTLVPLFTQKAEVWMKDFQHMVNRNFHIRKATLFAEGQKYLTEILKNSSSFISSTLSTTSGFLVNLSLIPLYVFLFLLYRDFLKIFLYKLFKKTSVHKINAVIKRIKEVVLSYMTGLILVIIIIGSLNTIALLFLDIPNAVFFGFFAAILVLIPYIGIAIGALLPVLVALITKDSSLYALGVAISFAVVQFLEGNFITPYIVGSKVSMNSLAAIISIILFGNLWGISGLVLALPITAILKVIFDSVDELKAWGYLLGDVGKVEEF